MSTSPDQAFQYSSGVHHNIDENGNPYYLEISSLSKMPVSIPNQQQPFLVKNYGYPSITDPPPFPNFEGPLGLYGTTGHSGSLPDYCREDFDNTLLLRNGHSSLSNEDNGYGPSSSGSNHWYGTSASNCMSPFNESFQNGSDHRHSNIANITSNGHNQYFHQGTSNNFSDPGKGFSLIKLQSPVSLDVKAEPGNNNFIQPHSVRSSATSSPLSSQLSPAKSTTPLNVKSPKLPSRPQTVVHDLKHTDTALRPKVSIPPGIDTEEYARQCTLAAYSSRLNPFSLHADEYKLLRDHLSYTHVTTYLNIRNGILRLWTRNPLVSVTREEAGGCAKEYRWLDLALVAYEWLVRRGYINFGCVEVPVAVAPLAHKVGRKSAKRKTILVVGAGMAGLGCARQLEGLITQYRERWLAKGEQPPRVIVVEGRGRIGGRVYSHPLQNQKAAGLPQTSRCTAEMGAHIITGFDHGNPLSMIIRGQLALHYHPLKDNSTLYDRDGSAVDKVRDEMVEKLYNDILDRVSVFRHKIRSSRTVEGNRGLIEEGRDPTGEDDEVISHYEALTGGRLTDNKPEALTSNGTTDRVPVGVDKLTGKAHMIFGSSTKASPALAAESMGWHLKSSVLAGQNLNLGKVAKASEHPTLGATMDEAVQQYQYLLDLSPQDMRLMNWHFANLEYANAANVGKLSLGGWDQDIGNEFEGEHAQIIGGYLQVPRALWQSPSKLDVRTRQVVRRIVYSTGDLDGGRGKIEFDNGETIDADRVVCTLPLGVLKVNSVRFEPSLPSWKTGAIERLGFGTLNKVILVYEEAFWDVNQDMFGLLRDSRLENSLDQEDYISGRGRFYLFWNCIKTCGRPMLIALMAGDAAHQAESTSDSTLIGEVTEQLGKMFKPAPIPSPSEVIVTRWGKDPFARGSYSYVGVQARPDDYDAMARPVGNLHFAGEATCGTHPATVHGAYLSGLRAASDVIESLLGPIQVRSPLMPPKIKLESTPIIAGNKRKADDSTPEQIRAKQIRLETYESAIISAICTQLGPRPVKPGKAGANPFLLYQKDHWYNCKNKCDEAHRAATGNPNSKASRHEVRAALGQMWREASEEVKRPYLERTASNKQNNTTSVASFEARLARWNREAVKLRGEYIHQHPGVLTDEEIRQMWEALGTSGGGRRAKKTSGYAEDSASGADEDAPKTDLE
ncbi:MAG: hypothetical protein M1830_006255 [Pleopsidium flavum]|nr:MAG: hypothetical protein M1830_006255 [Pleopsidium flavum]